MLKYTHACFALLSPHYQELRDEYQKAIIKSLKNDCIEKVQLSFRTYLESQIHYGAMVHENNRNILDYNNAYNHMLGKSDNVLAYKKVLRYYYEDISRLIFSLDFNVIPDFSLIGDSNIPRCEDLDTINLDKSKVLRNIGDILNGIHVTDNNLDYIRLANSIPIDKMSLNHITLVSEGALFRYLASNKEVINVIWR